MTTQSKPTSLNAWFRDNPGQAVRALPFSFGVFSVVLVASFLFPESNMSTTFTAASLAAAGAGMLHMGVRYLKTTVTSIRPESEESEESEPRGIAVIELVAGLTIAVVIALAVVPVMGSAVGR